MGDEIDVEFSVVVVIALGVIVYGLWGQYGFDVNGLVNEVRDWLWIRMVLGVLVVGVVGWSVIVTKLFSGNIIERFKKVIYP